MRQIRAWLLRLSSVFNKSRNEQEIADEFESNFQLHVEDNVWSGMTPDEARRAAFIKFGNADIAKEGWRDRRGIPIMETFIRDVSYTLRMLRQSKGWTAVAILSLALGIGVNTALFAVVNDILLQELNVPNPNELISFRWIGENNLRSTGRNYGFSAPDAQTGEEQNAEFSFRVFQQFQTQSKALAELFAIVPAPDVLRVSVEGVPELASGQFISGNFYTALGVSAVRGRAMTAADDAPAAEAVAVISHQYWERRFGLASDVVGRSIIINETPFTIIGVTLEGFGSTLRVDADPPDVSMPLAIEARVQPARSLMNSPAAWWVLIMGRLKPGVTPGQVQASLEGIYDQTVHEEWNAALPAMPALRRVEVSQQTNRVPRLQVVSSHSGIYDVNPEQIRMLKILGGTVGLILLIVCLNLANLLLSRAETRRKEIALRVAIGATRRRLIGQLLTESLVVAGIGGGFGVLLAYWCRTLLPVWFGFSPVDVEWHVVLFAGAITLLTAMVFGLAPAIRASRIDLIPAIRSHPRFGRSLVVAQVALSLILLIGAGLYLRTVRNLHSQELGFNPANLMVFSVRPSAGQSDESRSILFQRILDDIAAVPNVQSAALSDPGILTGGSRSNFIATENQSQREVRHQLIVSDTYFRTMEIPIRLGRGFTPQDNGAGPRVTIISDAFAREFFPNTNPIGQRVQVGLPAQTMEIVGVVGDAKYDDLREPAPSTFYIPDLQLSAPGARRWFIMRTSGDAATLTPAIRALLRSIDPALLPEEISTQLESINNYSTQERVFALTTSLLGMLALVISMIGIFGLMSYSVSRSTREIGIRMALGAQQNRVLRTVLSETLLLVLVGMVLGGSVAVAVTRFIAGTLFGLSPHDPLTIVSAMALMLLVAALAGYFPARRASRVDPMIALRHE